MKMALFQIGGPGRVLQDYLARGIDITVLVGIKSVTIHKIQGNPGQPLVEPSAITKPGWNDHLTLGVDVTPIGGGKKSIKLDGRQALGE